MHNWKWLSWENCEYFHVTLEKLQQCQSSFLSNSVLLGNFLSWVVFLVSRGPPVCFTVPSITYFLGTFSTWSFQLASRLPWFRRLQLFSDWHDLTFEEKWLKDQWKFATRTKKGWKVRRRRRKVFLQKILQNFFFKLAR